MHEALPNKLWIGNSRDARDLRSLYDHQISAVVDLAINEPPAQLAHEMVYVRVPLTDGDDNDDERIAMAIRSILLLLDQDFRILVACSAGMSRSPAIAAAALALITKQSPEDCLLSITSGSPHDVSPSFWSAVKSVYDQLHGA